MTEKKTNFENLPQWIKRVKGIDKPTLEQIIKYSPEYGDYLISLNSISKKES